MNLQTFKQTFIHSTSIFKRSLDEIRELLLGEGDESLPEEDWSTYNWPSFSNQALDHIKELSTNASKIHYFVVEDPRPNREDKEEIVYDSELFRNLHDILDYINFISIDLAQTYKKFTGTEPERTENKNDQTNVDGLTNYILEELNFLNEYVEQILRYLKIQEC